jgi:hypothetical protein
MLCRSKPDKILPAGALHMWRQRGGLSPFMFGLLMGMAVFSVYSLQIAKQQLAAQQAKNAARAQAEAADLAKGLEFSILTETEATYSDDYTLARAQSGAALASGQTRGNQDALLTTQRQDDAALGAPNEQVAILNSDDTLLRAQLYQTQSADDVARLQDTKNAPLAVIDTGAIRQRQVLTSVRSMEALAEHVYSFYAGQMRFPTTLEFDTLASKLGLADAWGQPFRYTRQSPDAALLEFTAPWNYTQSLKLSLKE